MEKTTLKIRKEKEKELLKFLNREILKSAKKGNFHYYWEITGLSEHLIKTTISTLEKEGKFFKSKGLNFKIIHW